MKLMYFQITNFAGNPTFTFDGRYTGAQTNGYGIGDFLLGLPSRASGSVGDGSQDMRTTFWSGYVQDDWRLASNVTLNFGLRYEFARSPIEINDRSMYFNPEQARIIVAGQGVRRDIVDPDWNNFAPSVGAVNETAGGWFTALTVTVTFENVAVAIVAGSWLVIAIPTYTVDPIDTVALPIVVHVVPLVER